MSMSEYTEQLDYLEITRERRNQADDKGIDQVCGSFKTWKDT